MANWDDFIDAGYTPESVKADSSRLVNWRLEPILSGKGKSKYALFRQPGTRMFVNTGVAAQGRGAFSVNGRDFRIIGNRLFEIFSNKTTTDRSTASGVFIQNDGRRAWMDSNPTQLAIVSGGHYYIFTLATNTLVEVTVGLAGTPTTVSFLDGFFVLTLLNSQQYQISALNDGTTLNALDISAAESRPDFIICAIEMKERDWMFGSQTIQPIFNAGSPSFPFQSDQSGISNTGILAKDSLSRNGDLLFFLGISESGGASFFKIEGLGGPTPVSTFAIESIFNDYQNLDQAYSWSYQENDHNCCRITFPDIDGAGTSRTWEYDDSLGPIKGWSETPFWNEAQGREESHRGRCSAASFGKVLISDKSNGKIYEFSSNFRDDDYNIIRRVRRAPHLFNQGLNTFYEDIEFDGNVGIGTPSNYLDSPYAQYIWTCPLDAATFAAALVALVGAGTITGVQALVLNSAYNNTLRYNVSTTGGIVTTSGGPNVSGAVCQGLSLTPISKSNPDPKIMLRWSNDGGMTYTQFVEIRAGQFGQYQTRMRRYGLGRARDRVFDMVVTDANDWAFDACNLNFTPGSN